MQKAGQSRLISLIGFSLKHMYLALRPVAKLNRMFRVTPTQYLTDPIFMFPGDRHPVPVSVLTAKICGRMVAVTCCLTSRCKASGRLQQQMPSRPGAANWVSRTMVGGRLRPIDATLEPQMTRLTIRLYLFPAWLSTIDFCCSVLSESHASCHTTIISLPSNRKPHILYFYSAGQSDVQAKFWRDHR